MWRFDLSPIEARSKQTYKHSYNHTTNHRGCAFVALAMQNRPDDRHNDKRTVLPP
jgi:hypothetical protein